MEQVNVIKFGLHEMRAISRFRYIHPQGLRKGWAVCS